MSCAVEAGQDRKDTIEVKSLSILKDVEGNDMVFIGDHEIPLDSFLFIAEYVLTNTDVEPNDPRFKFIEKVRGSRLVSGHNAHNNPNSKRIELYEP